MLSTGSATEVAFVIIAVIQAMFAVLWAGSAWWLQSARQATLHWAAWSLLSATTWLILAAHFDSPPLAGVLCGVLGALLLQRGIRFFVDKSQPVVLHVMSLLAAVLAFWIGSEPATRHLQAFINFGVLAVLYFAIGRDLYLHARTSLRSRWPVLVALPVLLGGAGYAARALRAVLQPASVLSEMTADSTLNLDAALTFIVLVLALHAVLVSLVVGRLVNELRRLSTHDALTGLFNRRAMEEALLLQVKRSRRDGKPFAVMMLDLDHFKRINDQFGHAVGDQALKHFADLLRSVLRDVDRLARFGGEEFVVLIPGATFAQAQPIAERLRESLAANPLVSEVAQVSMSVSIGLAEWREASDDASQLLLRADAALFQAKVQGRNRVVLAKSAKPAVFMAAVDSV